jgi:predicted Zn-dependent protease
MKKLILLFVFILSGCGKEIPEDRQWNIENFPLIFRMPRSYEKDHSEAVRSVVNQYNDAFGMEALRIIFSDKSLEAQATPLKPWHNNYREMTIFKTNIWEYPSNKLAITRTLDMKNYIYYANITFNTKDFVFNTDHNQDEGNKVDFHSVLLHEMGHVFGLKHSDDNDSVMQSELGFNKKRELTNYDIFQIRKLYKL